MSYWGDMIDGSSTPTRHTHHNRVHTMSHTSKTSQIKNRARIAIGASGLLSLTIILQGLRVIINGTTTTRHTERPRQAGVRNIAQRSLIKSDVILGRHDHTFINASQTQPTVIQTVLQGYDKGPCLSSLVRADEFIIALADTITHPQATSHRHHTSSRQQKRLSEL
jgi:hypothetical protein